MASISTCLTLSPKFRLLTSNSSVSLRLSGIQPLTSSSAFSSNSVNFLRPKVSFPVIKASLDVGSYAIRPGGAVETDKLPTDVRKRAMEAVDVFGGRVTVGDVSSKAGLDLNQAQKALQALASDTHGFLEVSDEGDVLYVFPKDYGVKLAEKSFRIKFELWVDKSKGSLEYMFRVSFGTVLVASIVLVFATIIFIVASSRDKRKRRSQSGSIVGSRSIARGLDYFLSPTDKDGKTNFIESVFSFVFGDGDPNLGIEEERWKLIGQYLASNGGVVTGEELAPYLDLPTTKGASSEESYVLPVLLWFDGQPEIDEEGNILYRFQSLQRTASSQRSGRKEYVGRRGSDCVEGFEKFLKEKKWQFSKTSLSERAMTIGLGAINLFGVIILGAMLKDVGAVKQSGLIKFVEGIFPLLQIYAGSFFAIPLVRWLFILKRNNDIEKRNQTRKLYAQALELPDLYLKRKLLSARDMAQKTVIGPDRIVYSTDRILVEQYIEALKEWNKRFQEIKKSE